MCSMKKLGLFLLKNNIHIMTLIFLGWAVWAACNWSHLLLVQKLVMGLYALLIVHEYEEGYKGRFVALFAKVFRFDVEKLTPGVTHIAQAVYITVIFSLALVFPDQLWLTFGVLILGIFEGFVHNWGIFMLQLKGVSPGWWTAVLMAAYAIWAIVFINRNIEYDGIQWLWAVFYFLGGFACLEVAVQRLMGNTMSKIKASVRAFAQQRFGKK